MDNLATLALQTSGIADTRTGCPASSSYAQSLRYTVLKKRLKLNKVHRLLFIQRLGKARFTTTLHYLDMPILSKVQWDYKGVLM